MSRCLTWQARGRSRPPVPPRSELEDPSVAATAACPGFRPVAKAFGEAWGIHVAAWHRDPGPLREAARHAVQGVRGRPLSRRIRSTILSENQPTRVGDDGEHESSISP